MDKIDYKKEFKDLYLPKTEPMIINVPKMNFVAVKGIGDPNEEGGHYQQAMQILYGITFTIKMSKMSGDTPDGYYDYVLPPLEGLWDISFEEITDFGIADKSKFKWISMIRLPDYVTRDVFEWAKEKLKKYIELQGYKEDFNNYRYRYHHEIYLSDPRKAKPENLKTVIRHPIIKK